MVDAITYRTNDATRWGTGKGSDLTATEIDINFWALFSQIAATLDHQNAASVISSITASGNNLFITLGDGTVFGPFTLPTANWNFRQDGWLPSTPYKPFDVFSYQGSLYLVLFQHVSAATFSPNANDGQGHSFYKLLLGPGPYDIAMFFPDFIPADGSAILMHVAARSFFLPQNLSGMATSAAMLRKYATSELVLPIHKNTTPIGAILFGGLESHGSTGPDVNADGSEVGTFVFTNAVQFNYGDRLLIYAPHESAGPDATAAGLAVTLSGVLGILASP